VPTTGGDNESQLNQIQQSEHAYVIFGMPRHSIHLQTSGALQESHCKAHTFVVIT